jgi:lysophospholipase L1-like esterase
VLRLAAFAWLIVGVTLGLLVLVELGLRVGFWVKDTVRPLPDPDPRIVADGYGDQGWVYQHFREEKQAAAEWRPYVYFRQQPFVGETIRVGADGRRATWNAGVKAPSVAEERPLRIWVLGGSTVWGMGARDDFTIPSLLSKVLNDRGHRVDVTNLGEVGYVSTQELLALELALRNGERPDVVVFLDGVNDVLATMQNGVAGWPQNEANRREEFEDHRHAGRLFVGALRRVVEGSAMARLAQSAAARLGLPQSGHAARHPWNVDEAARRRLVGETIEVYARNAELAAALGNDYGFRTRHYWQPTVFSKPRRHAVESEKAAQYAALDPWFAEITRRLKNAELIVDLSDVFTNEPHLIFWDFCHTTERGNQTIAEAIADDLEAAGLLDLSGSRTTRATGAK